MHGQPNKKKLRIFSWLTDGNSVRWPCTTMQATNKIQQIPFIDPFIDLFNLLYMFPATNSPILGALFDCIHSFWYNAPILLPTDRQQCQFIVPKAVYTVKKCSWGWASLSPETCKADLKRSIDGICCFLLVAYIVVLMMHGLTNINGFALLNSPNQWQTFLKYL